ARTRHAPARSATTTPAKATRKAGRHRAPISASCRSRGTERHDAKRMSSVVLLASPSGWHPRGRRDLRAARSEPPARRRGIDNDQYDFLVSAVLLVRL